MTKLKLDRYNGESCNLFDPHCRIVYRVPVGAIAKANPSFFIAPAATYYSDGSKSFHPRREPDNLPYIVALVGLYWLKRLVQYLRID